MKQQTLQNSFSLTGKGLHTGMDITITFLPAPENHGYKIQRIDLPEQPVIEAVADQVSETQRGTVVGKKRSCRKYHRTCHGCPLRSRNR